MNRVFLLSPANCNGVRARWLLHKNGPSALAQQLRSDGGAPIGDVFKFLSALYFRGKLTYAVTFARPPEHNMGVAIITPTAGLLPCDAPISIAQLRGFSRVPISIKNQRYRTSLCRAARGFADQIGPACEVVLLGSIASTKYLNLLLPIFGERLRVPAAFIGLGDMSRGGLLLRHVREQRELDYIAASSIPAVRVPRPHPPVKVTSPSVS
ncbi:MAG: hypothetical protein ACXWXT_02925 [Candidatus Binatia bacterium]